MVLKPPHLNEVTVYNVVGDWSPVEVDLCVGGRQVRVKVDSYSPEASEVVERTAGLELAEHDLKVGLQKEEEKAVTQELPFPGICRPMIGLIRHVLSKESRSLFLFPYLTHI